MKLAIKLAYRNLIGAGLRTVLNVAVLSLSFVIIIWLKGLMSGWDYQAKTDMTQWEIGGGQLWHQSYDPLDPLTWFDSHASIPAEMQSALQQGDMMAVLVVQGTVFPQGRMLPVAIKGIETAQQILVMPTQLLDNESDAIPVLIGEMMAKASRLQKGDRMAVRWRNASGTFDAADVEIVGVFSSNVPQAEQGQIYIALDKLQQMMELPAEATILTFRDGFKVSTAPEGWILKTKAALTKQVDEMIKTKSVGQSVLYFILLLLAMLAIFDTQVLSIFRRQKEIGTYVALGYTRKDVVGIFTVEGTMHAVFAAVLSMLYGLPFLAWQSHVGWTLPVDASEFGMAMAQTLYPVYSAGLVISTVLIVTITTAIVSYLPARKIAKMNPTDALRGKIQ
jgi:putative ABC transport system permease protein